MSQFNSDDRVIISSECKDEQYRGISGTVLETKSSSDGLVNRVCLDISVGRACVFWFADHELVRVA